MGRADNEELTAAQIFYPCMQCADIFFLKVSIFILQITTSSTVVIKLSS
jgi:tyrosyl-tRNA synthetase